MPFGLNWNTIICSLFTEPFLVCPRHSVARSLCKCSILTEESVNDSVIVPFAKKKPITEKLKCLLWVGTLRCSNWAGSYTLKCFNAQFQLCKILERASRSFPRNFHTFPWSATYHEGSRIIRQIHSHRVRYCSLDVRRPKLRQLQFNRLKLVACVRTYSEKTCFGAVFLWNLFKVSWSCPKCFICSPENWNCLVINILTIGVWNDTWLWENLWYVEL